jgi:hypothetical protein
MNSAFIILKKPCDPYCRKPDVAQAPLIPFSGLLLIPYPLPQLLANVLKIILIPLYKALVKFFPFLECVVKKHHSIIKRSPKVIASHHIALGTCVHPINRPLP